MKKIFRIAISFAIVFSFTFNCSAFASSNVPNSVIDASNSVFKIVSRYTDGYASGTGFVISNDNREILLATNHHVIENDPISIDVYVGRDDIIHAIVICSSKWQDLAILKLESYYDAKPLSFAEEETLKGTAVYAIGFPALADYLSDTVSQTSEETTITDGIVSALRQLSITEYGSKVAILQTNADINHGNSGGPLLTSDGKVVGINTYGISEASGIYGAISTSELESLLAANGIHISSSGGNSSTVSGIIWIIVSVCVLFLITIFIVILKKRKGKMENIFKHNYAKTPPVTLRSYLMQYPNGLSVENTVNLLLPLASRIQILHSEGTTQLPISPDTITITDGQPCILPHCLDSGSIYYSGFTAPEVYKGVPDSVFADVYSFASIFYYVLTGSTLMNSLTRTDNSLCFPQNIFDDGIKAFLEKALALDPADRFATFNEIVEILTPYNRIQDSIILPSDNSPEQHIIKKPVANIKNKKRFVLVVTVGVFLFLCILCGIHFFKFSKAVAYTVEGDFVSASNVMPIRFITALHDSNFNDYIDAGISRRDRNYEEATKQFTALGNYRDSHQLSLDCMADQALQLVNKNDFEAAYSIYNQLIQEGYSSANEFKQKARYREGAYLLYEEANFLGARNIYIALSKENYDGAEDMLNEVEYCWGLAYADDEDYLNAFKKFTGISKYKDSSDYIDALAELVYQQGVQDYRDGGYSKAKNYFQALSSLSNGYKRSKDYLTLINAHNAFYYSEAQENSLIALIGFEDAGKLIFMNYGATSFVMGSTFKGSLGSIRFYESGGEDWASWSWSMGSGHWNFDDGYFTISDKKMYEVYATDYYTMVWKSVSNGKTYIMTRS